MKLLFVLDHFGAGGAQGQMVLLARGLATRGHEVEFFTYHPGPDHFQAMVEASSIPIRTYRKRGRFDPRPLLALRRHIRQWRPHAVLAFLTTPSLYAELASVSPGSPPVVISQRSAYPPGGLSRPVWVLEQFHRLARRVVVNSHHQRLRMATEFPWMEGRLVTVWNGVELERFRPSDGDLAASAPASEEREDAQPPDLLVLANTERWKNVKGVAEALVMYAERFGRPPTVRWAGRRSPAPEDVVEERSAEALLQRHGLQPHLQWLGVRRDVPELLAQHDALLHPATLEGLPNAVCEAMAMARPVLAGRWGDHALLVEDGVRGFLFDPSKPYEMASAMRKLASLSVEERVRMGRAGRGFAESELSAARFIDRYEVLLGTVVREAGLAGSGSNPSSSLSARRSQV